MHLDCTTVEKDISYYCIASNDISKQESEILSVQVLVPADINCIYVVKMQVVKCAKTRHRQHIKKKKKKKMKTSPFPQRDVRATPTTDKEPHTIQSNTHFTILEAAAAAVAAAAGCGFSSLALGRGDSLTDPVMGVTHFLLLCALSMVVTAQDCGRPELPEGMVLKGDAILQETFQDGSSVSLGCDPGYQSSGPPSLTCTGGTWSTLRMTCTKRNCGSVGEVVNGDVEYPEGTLFGAVLQVRCNPGYRRVGGSKVIRCDVQGWDGRLPVCEAVVCEVPPAVENANVSPLKDSYQYRDSIKYTCLRDYTLIGQASLTCSDDGTFTPNPPECKNVQCAEPVIKNGGWNGGARPPYTYKSTVILKCEDGYQMEGDGTITCEKDNNWSPQLPTCKIISTTPKATTTTTTPSTTTTTTSSKKPGGSVVVVVQNPRRQHQLPPLTVFPLSTVQQLIFVGDSLTDPVMGVTHFLLLCALSVVGTSQDCGRPELEEGMVLKGDAVLQAAFQDGSSVSLGCDPGYQSSGPSSLTCTGGTWSTLRMTCTKRNCGSAGEVVNGDVEYPEGTLFGAVLQVRCNPGYKRVGGTRVMRCDVRGWYGRLPECEDAQCAEPVIKNGGWDGGARPPYTYKSTVILKCDAGFTMEGDGSITCEKDNNWSPQLPTCKRGGGGPKPTPPGSGSYSVGKTVGIVLRVLVGFIAVITGGVVYKKRKRGESLTDPVMGVTHFLLLCALSVVGTAQDCGRPELEEGMVLKGDAILQETFQNGSSVSLGCVPGYQSSGRSSLTCRRGSWSTLTMICKKRNCGSAGEVFKGDVEYPEGTLFGAVLQVRCNPGYRRVGGTRVMRCDVRGWNGRLPECEAVVCEVPPAVEHANVRPVKESYQYRDSIKYTCLRDYTLIGQASLTCSDDGTFTPDPPECINVNCDEPVIKNGGWNGGARPPYTYLSTVILKCEDGYQMEGAGTITCEKDNNWSPQLPTCKPVPCEVPPAVEHASVSPVKDSYHYRDSIEYTCVSNYTLIGQASLTCSKYGTFTPNPPECRHVQCAEPVIKNGGWDGGARPPYTYKSTVILKCEDGYQMEGDGTITCEKDNNWSPQLPTCKPVPCEVPPAVEHANVSPVKDSYHYKDSIDDFNHTSSYYYNYNSLHHHHHHFTKETR
ncbi:hypothetical protein INR49_000010, partial [Caranx melampygus]